MFLVWTDMFFDMVLHILMLIGIFFYLKSHASDVNWHDVNQHVFYFNLHVSDVIIWYSLDHRKHHIRLHLYVFHLQEEPFSALVSLILARRAKPAMQYSALASLKTCKWSQIWRFWGSRLCYSDVNWHVSHVNWYYSDVNCDFCHRN